MKDPSFRKISTELFSLAFPMAFTQLIAVGSGFVFMVMLSGLGSDVLAASALIFSARISILVIGASILFSLSILIGHAYGEKEYCRIGNFIQQGWTVALFLSIPITIIFWNLDSILTHCGQPKLLTTIVRQFFHANVWQVVPFLLAVSNQQLFYGTRKQRIDLIVNVVGVIVGVSSAYLFIFGNLGFPKLGVTGLGYALNLQGLTYFLLSIAVIYFDDFFKRFDLFTYRVHQNWHDVIRMCNIGWPICVQIGVEMLSLFASAAMVGWLGVQSLAAYQVVTQYFFLIVVPLFALSQASGVLIGQALGEKNYFKIKKVGHAGVIFSLIITLIVAFVFIAFPKQLASLYLNVHNPSNAEIIKLIILLFVIFAIQQIFDSVRNVLTGSLRGLFDTKFPMVIGLISLWVIGIPLGYLLAFNLHFGVSGIVIGSTIGVFVGMLLLLYRWQKLTDKYFETL